MSFFKNAQYWERNMIHRKAFYYLMSLHQTKSGYVMIILHIRRTVWARACSWKLNFKDESENRNMCQDALIRSHRSHWPYCNPQPLIFHASFLPLVRGGRTVSTISGKLNVEQPARQTRWRWRGHSIHMRLRTGDKLGGELELNAEATTSFWIM